MGMDAQVDVWVGVKLDGTDGWDTRQAIAKRLPKEFLDDMERESDEPDLSLHYDVEGRAGFALTTMMCSEETVGFGIVVFHHDWDYGVAEFKLDELATKIEEKRRFLAEKFKEWGIEQPIGVYVQTDFS